jgi:hypothetical protein
MDTICVVYFNNIFIYLNNKDKYIKYISRQNRTLHLYVVTAINLDLI